MVWNPWAEKAKGFADLEEGDYKYFVCVEPGFVKIPLTISPGQLYRAQMEITALSSRL